MAKYILILRGINVGANRKVPMADLKVLCAKLRLQNLQTYIQSGNVVFELPQPESVSELENRLQKAFTETFGFDIPVIVRTIQEIEESITNNPFLKEKDVDVDKLHLTFLKEEPSPELLEKTKALQFLPDRFEIIGRDVFVYCENGYGRTKITNDFFEKKLKVQSTTRNWKTVMKLHEMINSIQDKNC
jgi:uncharacterized protein (DUF1697 family)